MRRLARLRGVEPREIEERYGIDYGTLTREEASELIDLFEALLREEEGRG